MSTSHPKWPSILPDNPGGAASVAAHAMLDLMREIYPLCRSITGPGLRETYKRIGKKIPLQSFEVPSGTRVYDWMVPDEWSVSEAYIEGPDGRRVVDIADHNLHLVNYSEPVDRVISLDELWRHLHTLPAQPELIPYRTSYYHRSWGFCLSENHARSLPKGQYRVVIRSSLAPGSLTVAEFVHHGEREDEILVFAHCCHPSLVNDNLSGIAVASLLADHLREHKTRYTYRFVFAPATIGSIAWLAQNEARLNRIRHGLVLAMLGDNRPLRYKATFYGDREIDVASRHALSTFCPSSSEVPYSPWGFDERQFASPGIRMAVGRLTRALPGEMPEEHTSADDFGVISGESLAESWLTCLRIFDVLERNESYVNLSPRGEPQLGRRGLFRKTGGHYDGVPERQLAMLWLLERSDGTQSLLDIATRSGLPFDLLANVSMELVQVNLLGRQPKSGIGS